MWHVVSRLASRVALSVLFACAFLTILAQLTRAEPLTLDPPRYFVDPLPAAAPPAPAPAPTRVATARGNMGGGFIEFIFGGGNGAPAAQYQDTRAYAARGPVTAEEYARPPMDPKFLPQTVAYDGPEKPGTIVIDTPQHFLFLVEPGGTARRYGIGVGRPGFTWAGVKTISAKREWPDWRPPTEMLQRRPDLPVFMAGGPENPLGARAMYLGSSLYRIHGSNEPWTIGTAVSSGCIRMRNEDVIDLYERVKVGTRVIVI
jgi:lipoprotein-anchoring transpeptidase ErfK/SrfK